MRYKNFKLKGQNYIGITSTDWILFAIGNLSVAIK